MSVVSAAAVVSIGGTIYNSMQGSDAAGLSSDAVRSQMSIAERQQQMAEDNYNLYRPLNESLVADASKGLDPEKYAGMAVTDVGQQFDTQRGSMRRLNESYGLRPDAGRVQGGNRALGIAEALGKAHAANKTRLAVDDTNFNRKLGVAGLGRGLAESGMASAASTYGSAANTSMNQAGAYGRSAGSWAGLGLDLADRAGWLKPSWEQEAQYGPVQGNY